MTRIALPAGLAVALALLTTCVGCSTSTLVQTSEIADLINGPTGVAVYIDEAAPRILPADEADAAAQEVEALRVAIEAPEIGRDALASVLVPALDTYEALVTADPDLSEPWRQRRLRDIPILRRVAGLSDG